MHTRTFEFNEGNCCKLKVCTIKFGSTFVRFLISRLQHWYFKGFFPFPLSHGLNFEVGINCVICFRVELRIVWWFTPAQFGEGFRLKPFFCRVRMLTSISSFTCTIFTLRFFTLRFLYKSRCICLVANLKSFRFFKTKKIVADSKRS